MSEYSLVSLDPTIVRPRSQPISRQNVEFAPTLQPARPTPRTAPSSQQATEPGIDMASVRPNEEVDGSFARFSQGGVNPLVRAAAPLLILAGRLREQIAEVDLHRLHEQCSQELHHFQIQAVRAGVPPDDVDAAAYTLCSLIDEAVLGTPWGARSNWAARSLLLTFHDESSGWDEVVHIAGSARSDPTLYRALLEFLYLCLSVGFENPERLGEQRVNQLTLIREDLFTCIQTLRDSGETDLSPQWMGAEDKRRAVTRVVPLSVVAAGCVALLIGVFVFFSASLSKRSEPLNAMLARVGHERPYSSAPEQMPELSHAPASVPIPVRAESPAPPAAVPEALVPGLRELLSVQMAQGLVRVEDAPGGRTVVIVTVSDLFTSGSARINPRYAQLIDEVSIAMERIPGHYRVTGHTDDLPVHSLRFPDNFALSRERAREVVGLMKTRISDAGRLDFEGMGSSEPRYKPESLPENRARNRRVEISLLSGG
jgi:type VI secretion system protein ImpK